VGLPLVSPLLFVAIRLVAAAALLALVMAVGRQSWAPLRGRWHHLALAGVLVNGVTLSAFHVGMVTENAAGVVLVVAPRALESAGAWGAIRLGFVGVASLAGGTIYFGRYGRGVPLLPATAVQLGAAAVLTVALTLLFERPHAVWTFPAVASVAWNVIAVSIGAMALYYYMLNHGTAGRVAANFYLIPGTVALLGWALLGERLTPLAMLGFAIASIGVFLVARRQPEE
jgi:drug/metabolite transporter (DMT)-like permease